MAKTDHPPFTAVDGKCYHDPSTEGSNYGIGITIFYEVRLLKTMRKDDNKCFRENLFSESAYSRTSQEANTLAIMNTRAKK